MSVLVGVRAVVMLVEAGQSRIMLMRAIRLGCMGMFCVRRFVFRVHAWVVSASLAAWVGPF